MTPTVPLPGAPERAPGPGGLPAHIDRWVDGIGRAASWLTLAIVLLMACNVLLRYGLSIGSVWAQELEWHLLVPLVMFGITYALRHGEHVRVDMLYGRYSPAGQALVDVLSGLLAATMAALMVYFSIRYVGQSWSIGEISPDPGGLHYRWALKALIPLGFVLFAVQALGQSLAAAQRWRAAVRGG